MTMMTIRVNGDVERGPPVASAVKPEKKKSEPILLLSNTNAYILNDFIAEGCYGKVANCENCSTSEKVAIKFMKNWSFAEREVEMLDRVSTLDPVKNNVVRFIESFQHDGCMGLVFERLDRDLHSLLEEKKSSLTLNEIRPITYQMLKTLDALKCLGVIHADLKPDNIMLVNHENEPFRVKLIDFGTSVHTSENIDGENSCQPPGYRAPEVVLGLHLSEAIDMWGLGCVLLFLCLGQHPFSDCDYQSMNEIVYILGKPANSILRRGIYTTRYFKMVEYDKERWLKQSPQEYELDTGIKPEKWSSCIRSLYDLITDDGVKELVELEDQRAFVSLLRNMLEIDPKKRITPEQALGHHFVKMGHLMDKLDTSAYVKDSFSKMAVILMDKGLHPDGNAEPVDATCLTEENHSDEVLQPNGDAEPVDATGLTVVNDLEEELHRDDDLDEQPKGEKPSTMPYPFDGAEVPGLIDTTGSNVKESVNQGPASASKETSANGRTPDVAPPQDKKSQQQRKWKFFSRVLSTLSGKRNKVGAKL